MEGWRKEAEGAVEGITVFLMSGMSESRIVLVDRKVLC